MFFIDGLSWNELTKRIANQRITNQLKSVLAKLLSGNNRLERLWLLAKMDFKQRYYDHGLGILWALLNPMCRLMVYYFVFTKIMTTRVPSFTLYLFSGIVVWMFFVQGTKKGINLLKNKKYLLESIQFEHLDLFMSATLSAFLAFMFNLAAYFVLHFANFTPIFKTAIFLPVLIINVFILVLGVSMLLATINIYLRDIEHLWDVVILGGFWLTPIIYPKEALLDNFAFLAYINPMTGIVINFRETVLYGREPMYNFFFYDIAYALILLILGVILFKMYGHKAAEKL